MTQRGSYLLNSASKALLSLLGKKNIPTLDDDMTRLSTENMEQYNLIAWGLVSLSFKVKESIFSRALQLYLPYKHRPKPL